MAYYSDVDNKFRLNAVGDVRLVEDEEAVAQAVENILLTRAGERVMRPRFGSYLESLLFEPISEETGYKIALEIYRALKQDDRYDVDKVDVYVDEEIGAYRVHISLLLRPLQKRVLVVRILTRG